MFAEPGVFGPDVVVEPNFSLMRCFVKSKRCFLMCCAVTLLCVPLLTGSAAAQKKNNSKYACSESQPEKLCNTGNTCGSASAPCTVDVKRTRNGATATPGITNAKANSLFCVKQGTTITWQSTSKNTGFVVDFGPDSPFDQPDAIIGGANRPISVVAKKTGCYKYSAGACISGSVYGMCGSAQAEAIVIP